jgi:hypothetical protein
MQKSYYSRLPGFTGARFFSRNPTIFNIIRWNDGTTERSSRHPAVQIGWTKVYFDRLGIIQ